MLSPYPINQLLHRTCVLTAILYLLRPSSAQQISTVSSSSSTIDYSSSDGWIAGSDSNATDGSYMFTRTPGVTATFSATFRSLKFSAPLWPFPLSFNITIDPDPSPHRISLQDTARDPVTLPSTGLGPSSQPSRIVFNFTGTENIQRSVTVFSSDSLPGIAVIDSFILVIGNADESSSSTSNPNLSSSSTAAAPVTTTSSLPSSGGLSPSSLLSPSSETHGSPSGTSRNADGTTPLSASTSTAAPSITSVDKTPPSDPVKGQHNGGNATLLISVLCTAAAIVVFGGLLFWYLKRKRQFARHLQASTAINKKREELFESADSESGDRTDEMETSWSRKREVESHDQVSDEGEDERSPRIPVQTLMHDTNIASRESLADDWSYRFGKAYDALSRNRSLSSAHPTTIIPYTKSGAADIHIGGSMTSS